MSIFVFAFFQTMKESNLALSVTDERLLKYLFGFLTILMTMISFS